LNEEVNTFQRKFVTEVRRHDELERKIRYIQAEMAKDGLTCPEAPVQPRVPNPRESIDLEVSLKMFLIIKFMLIKYDFNLLCRVKPFTWINFYRK
jgi:hypothetical protein